MIHLPLPGAWTTDTLPEYIEQLLDFVKRYAYLAECSTRDAFTKGLPVNWAPELSTEDWIQIVNGRYTAPLPQPLSKFVQLAHRLPLRDAKDYKTWNGRESRRGMSLKKDHEVDAMVNFLSELISTQNIKAKSVVDVGSGLGYLSTELAKLGFSVIGIEGDADRAKKATPHCQFKSVNKVVTDPEDLGVTSESLISVSLRTSLRYWLT